MTESIHELFGKVREHPDFAGGTVFTREDVATAVFELEDDPTEDQIAKVTDEMLRQSEQVIESYIFEGGYSWADALRENVGTSPTAGGSG